MTDYFQGVAAEYLRADRGMFVNPEILLQLDPGASPKKGRFWYCDLMAVSLREQAVFLCEVMYSSTAAALIKRLNAWRAHWADLKVALQRDCGVDPGWSLSPWVFLPEVHKAVYDRRLSTLRPLGSPGMPEPKITFFEQVVPWKYCTWNRHADA